jgi:hypothetical protein
MNGSCVLAAESSRESKIEWKLALNVYCIFASLKQMEQRDLGEREKRFEHLWDIFISVAATKSSESLRRVPLMARMYLRIKVTKGKNDFSGLNRIFRSRDFASRRVISRGVAGKRAGRKGNFPCWYFRDIFIGIMQMRQKLFRQCLPRTKLAFGEITRFSLEFFTGTRDNK